jgi:hypothetical protein
MLEFLLFDGGAVFLQSPWEALGPCALWRAGLLAPAQYLIVTQWGIWDSLSWTGEMDSSAGRCSVKHLASVYLGGTGYLVLCTEQVIAFLHSVGNLVFFLFGRGARALLLSGTVRYAEPPCSVRREASWCHKIPNPVAWGSLGCVVLYFWHWVAVEGIHGAAELGGFNHLVSTRQWWPWHLFALGHRLPEVIIAAADSGDTSPEVAPALRLACWFWAIWSYATAGGMR